MNNHIEVIENFLSKDECEFILFKYKNELKLSFAQTSIGIDKNRKSSVGWINELNGINERLTDLFIQIQIYVYRVSYGALVLLSSDSAAHFQVHNKRFRSV